MGKSEVYGEFLMIILLKRSFEQIKHASILLLSSIVVTHLFISFFLYCNKTPVENSTNQFTSHNYRWEIDTLYSPEAMQIYMHDVWGTNENNVWVVGHSDDVDYQIWHWDGISWQNTEPGIIGDRPSYHELIGFSRDDIWIAGHGIYSIGNDPKLHHREYILHYNGSQWKRYNDIKAPMCLSVWGTSGTDLFFGCDSGIVLYYDGSTWQKQQTGTDAQICSIWGFDPDHVYATGYSLNNQDFHFFKKVNDHWESQGNGLFSEYGNFVWGLDLDHLYRVTSNGVQQFKNGMWEYILFSRLVRCMFGDNENNIFVAGYKNTLFHYNGETWHQYREFEEPNREFFGIWCNDSIVFLIMGSLDYTYMVRGYRSLQ